MRRVPSAVVLLLALLAAGCAEPRKPNLIIFTLDTFRADRLAAHGNAKGLTPALDALAAESTVFENCTSPMGYTRPAHASLFTGRYPRAHGVRANDLTLLKDYDTLAERLAAAGYVTAAFATNAIPYHGDTGQGFEVTGFGNREKKDGPGVGTRTNRHALEWIASDPDQPFLLWVHYFDAHSPLPLTPYAEERFGDYDGPLADGASNKEFYHQPGLWLEAGPNHDAMLVLYDGMVVEVDRLFRQVRDELESMGALEDAYVLVVADHGESLGEHGHPGHGPLLWQSVLGIPCFVWDSHTRKPRRVEERVSLVDFAPTLLELASQPPLEGIQGRSLAPALRGERLPARPYFAEMKNLKGVAVFEGRYKLIRRQDGSTELFDLEADPGELSPLKPGQNPELRQRLEEMISAFKLLRPLREAPEEELTEEERDALRALGYVDI